MPSKRRLEIAVLALACVGAPSCSNGAAEGPRTPAGGTTSTPGPSGGGTLSGNAGGTPSAGSPSGGVATGGGTTSSASATSSGGSALAGSASGGSASGGSSGGPWTFPAGVTKPRIMIVGDSISAGPGCYKKFLLKDLTDNGYSNFEFVGEYTDDCGGGVRHSAVSCSTAEQYTMPTFTMPNCFQGQSFPGMSSLVTTHKPDLIMLQLGVNDVWGGKTTENILSNYAKLIEQARAQNPKVVLVVAQIQKIRPDCSDDDSITKRAEALVNAVPAWAMAQNQAESPVFVADLWTSSDWSKSETLDCVHPNDVGAARMGLNWFNTLKNILEPG